jgi:hypothetical protein
LKPAVEEDGWKDNGWEVDEIDDVPVSKTSAKQESSGWDVDIEDDDWEDDDNWDFAAKTPSKLDLAKQKKQETKPRTGKKD